LALAPTRQPADVVLVSARIWTGDPARQQAAALASRDGRIVAVGTDAEIEALRGPTTVVVEGKGHPPGGIIVRDASGELIGVLKDAAMDLIAAVRPPRTIAEVEEALATAVRHAAGNGVTIPERELDSVRVEATVAGGRVVYSGAR
jgi:predicted amidohydrolase YtcJ